MIRKIIFAKKIGFCPGIKRAVLIAEEAFKKSPKPIYFLGSLVHNEEVLKKFKKRGGKFIRDLKEAKSGTLIIRAHGIPPFPQKFKKKLLIVDATCPLVKRVQLLANSLYKKNYQIIIIGDKKHSETKGIKGYTENQAIIIENEKQAEKLAKFKKLAVIVQTTMDFKKSQKIFKILKNKSEEIKYFNTICPEVESRQNELKLILKKIKEVLIIGSKTSANTRRLVQIAKKAGKFVRRVNSLAELKKEGLPCFSSLGVISGTSTPNEEIKKIKKYLISLMTKK